MFVQCRIVTVTLIIDGSGHIVKKISSPLEQRFIFLLFCTGIPGSMFVPYTPFAKRYFISSSPFRLVAKQKPSLSIFFLSLSVLKKKKKNDFYEHEPKCEIVIASFEYSDLIFY